MGYSARVEGWLRIDDQWLEMGQIGPEWIIVRNSTITPPRQGEIIIRIDDNEDCFAVFLPNGVDPSVRKTRYEKLAIPNEKKRLIQQQLFRTSDF